MKASNPNPKTLYLRVNGTEVIIVEINLLDKKQNLQDKHIQEIIQLLQEKIVARVEHIHKKTEQQRGSKDTSGILTGTSVRIGYAFKNKPKNQTVLYSSDKMQLGNCSTDMEIKSLKVVTEKLVVYVQLFIAGSPKGISQLLRRLSDVKHSEGNGVSISSYFQRVSSSQSSQTQSSTSKITSTVGVDQSDDCILMANFVEPCETKSGEGKKRKIKNILKRGNVEGQKKHKQPIADKGNELNYILKSFKTETESVVQYDQKLLSKEQIQLISKSETMISKSETLISKGEELISKSEAHDKSIGEKVVEIGSPKVTAQTDQKHSYTVDKPHSSSDSASKDISGHLIKVVLDNMCMDQECRPHSSSDSASKDISGHSIKVVLNNKGMDQECRPHSTSVSASKNDSGHSIKVLNNRGMDQVCIPHSTSVSASKDISGHSIKVVLDNRGMEQECFGIKKVDLVNTGTFNVINEMPGIKENLTFSSPETEDSKTDSSDSEILPSVSFCTKAGTNRLSYFDSDTLKDILNVDESKKQTFSPVFNSKLRKHQVDILEKENNNESIIPNGATNNADCDSKKLAHGRRLDRFRYKRKYPKCFDSDSEDSLPDQKRQNIALEQDDKVASLTVMKKDCKKLKISKDFFSESQTKSQSKLNVFIKNKKENEHISNSDLREPRQLYDVDPKSDIELNEELSDFPLIQNEMDTELLKEIQCLSGVENLNEEQIRFLIKCNERYLNDISKGKVKCERHDAYKKGGNCRRDLNHNSRLGPYSDEQIDIVMECLISLFCKKHHKYLDYIMKVLLTEMLIKFHMEVHKKSYKDSEQLLAPKTPEHLKKVLMQ